MERLDAALFEQQKGDGVLRIRPNLAAAQSE